LHLGGATAFDIKLDRSGRNHTSQKSYHPNYGLLETEPSNIPFFTIEVDHRSRDMDKGYSEKIRQGQTRASPLSRKANADGKPNQEKD
jgi:hypothetical protein